MARKRKPQAAENTEGWLTTYADLISLLLCFFVLMYAASTPDEAKMQFILQSFSRVTGTIVNPVHANDDEAHNTEEDGNEVRPTPNIVTPEAPQPGVPGTMPLTFDDLFNWVSKAVDSMDVSAGVSAEMKEGRLHIRFDSDVMFAPDSSVLRPAGREALRQLAPGIRAFDSLIGSVVVEGHTAAPPGGGFPGLGEWQLSSDRAVSVTNYLDHWERMVESGKFETKGLGPHHPYASNEQEETRALNRRVELVITRNNFQPDDTPVMIDVIKSDYQLGPIPVGPNEGREVSPGDYDKVRQIRQNIERKYGVNVDTGKAPDPPGGFDFTIPGMPVLPPDESDNGAAQQVT
jgi:chemotaxis protein MotB